MISSGIFKIFGERERERDVRLDAKYKFNFTVIITAINKKKS